MQHELVARLQERQEREGITTAAMARRLGISRSYLYYVYIGARPLTLQLARRIATLYPDLARHAADMALSRVLPAEVA